MNELILLAGLILIAIYLFTKNQLNKIEEEKNPTTKGVKTWSNLTEKQILFCYDFVRKKTYQKLLTNKDDIIMTTLMFQESGIYVLNKKNWEIKGDNGNSIGYFQIYIKGGALQDVNKNFGGNWTTNDLYDENVNILVASRYFYLCLHRNNNGKDFYEKLWLAAKRYNGGINETLTSKNERATNYANLFLKNFSLVENVLRYNNKI